MKVGDLVKVWNSNSVYARTDYVIGTIVEDFYYMEPDDEDRMGQYYWTVLSDGKRDEINQRRLEVLGCEGR